MLQTAPSRHEQGTSSSSSDEAQVIQESTTWCPEPSDPEDSNNCDDSPDNIWDLDPSSNLIRLTSLRGNPVKTRLVVEEPKYDPWEWTRSIQREQMNKTWDGRIVRSWTRRKSVIFGLMFTTTGLLLVLLLRVVFGHETLQAIVVAGYTMAIVVAVGIGSVLEIQLR